MVRSPARQTLLKTPNITNTVGGGVSDVRRFSVVWLRGDWPISPSKFHAYPSYRSVHWLLVKQWVWDLLL